MYLHAYNGHMNGTCTLQVSQTNTICTIYNLKSSFMVQIHCTACSFPKERWKSGMNDQSLFLYTFHKIKSYLFDRIQRQKVSVYSLLVWCQIQPDDEVILPGHGGHSDRKNKTNLNYTHLAKN